MIEVMNMLCGLADLPSSVDYVPHWQPIKTISLHQVIGFKKKFFLLCIRCEAGIIVNFPRIRCIIGIRVNNRFTLYNVKA